MEEPEEWASPCPGISGSLTPGLARAMLAAAGSIVGIEGPTLHGEGSARRVEGSTAIVEGSTRTVQGSTKAVRGRTRGAGGLARRADGLARARAGVVGRRPITRHRTRSSSRRVKSRARVVGILGPRLAAVDRLAQRGHRVLRVLPGPPVAEQTRRRCGQIQGVIGFAVGQEPRVAGRPNVRQAPWNSSFRLPSRPTRRASLVPSPIGPSGRPCPIVQRSLYSRGQTLRHDTGTRVPIWGIRVNAIMACVRGCGVIIIQH